MTWRELLEAEIREKGQSAVAHELGYSSTTLSLVRRNKYPGGTDRIEAKVLEVFGEVSCPFLGQSIPADQCRRTRLAPVPTSSPRALQHWSACRTCPHFQGDKP